MTPKKLLVSAAAASLLGFAGLAATTTGAAAYTACNHEGDCWHTDTRVHIPGVTLSFHDDKWWDHHRHDTHYSWHDSDTGHDWHHGYWSHGTWHST